ncbi:MAG TPA: hypothetical protein DEG17_10895 [Cyanobacteria bacterium UBA11149]|nr:hypothetical protein [Cyanobacteria bacterium UBA11367]HBE57338.1 hypothetical protein [Cyanobacteria bacterium UBA11366]HBK64443.1 hypothetical protein [Cyanobacteria bacterium UBA11166]HBR72333.1 hypothetical protein [Cyanobacteria bacterium UBA11159]HBS70411.1 hypothetical protein [Cyanobacteria bacterium UBA11153]HBW89355.1 hypothetical protein [Cyanobacteria bacterium UBA11149]HCA97659.1 hypothetical protein [Cyanobacteria bacterium UBA9226]
MHKLTLMVCPHDTAKNPDRWFRFVQYLNNHLSINVRLEISLDFQDFRNNLDGADIVYANPADTIYLLEQKQFLAVVRPINLYDEVVFIANHEIWNPGLDSLQMASVATVNSMLPTKLALKMLKDRGIVPSQLIDRSSWLGVVNSVSKNEASFGIIYKDTYDELSPKTQEMVTPFAVSDERVIFHVINISQNALKYKEELRKILVEMNINEAGKDVFKELKIEGWQTVTSEEIEKIKQIQILAIS